MADRLTQLQDTINQVIDYKNYLYIIIIYIII